VIGHELTHGFDDQGRKIDASGALRDWWTKKDADEFQARAKILGAQYSKYEPIPSVHVNGELTMGENIADLGGLTLALDAYRASLKGQPAPVLDGYTGDQRVLLGWAQAWRGKVTDDYVKKQVVSDPHSPRQFRVIGPTRNTDVWYDAFKVQSSDKMFVAPDHRVRICARLRLQSATDKLHSAVLSGGIAQLVERQLCKLEVRGSNPLASSLRSRRSLGEGGYLFGLLHFSRELRLGKPVMKQFFFVYVLQ